jgi:hypothetical protein
LDGGLRVARYIGEERRATGSLEPPVCLWEEDVGWLESRLLIKSIQSNPKVVALVRVRSPPPKANANGIKMAATTDYHKRLGTRQ